VGFCFDNSLAHQKPEITATEIEKIRSVSIPQLLSFSTALSPFGRRLTPTHQCKSPRVLPPENSSPRWSWITLGPKLLGRASRSRPLVNLENLNRVAIASKLAHQDSTVFQNSRTSSSGLFTLLPVPVHNQQTVVANYHAKSRPVRGPTTRDGRRRPDIIPAQPPGHDMSATDMSSMAGPAPYNTAGPGFGKNPPSHGQ